VGQVIKLLVRAHRLNTTLVRNEDVAFAALAMRDGVSRSYFTRVARLSYLAPDITQAILEGRQPREGAQDEEEPKGCKQHRGSDVDGAHRELSGEEVAEQNNSEVRGQHPGGRADDDGGKARIGRCERYGRHLGLVADLGR
jgi:hypothetical protein